MSRPSKDRRICEMPHVTSFGNLNKNRSRNREVVHMSVDEYEALRLIDYEELNQEECAKQMNVARTTAQRIYNVARKKLATVLVTGADLKIEGGSYVICSGRRQGGGYCGRCRRGQKWEEEK